MANMELEIDDFSIFTKQDENKGRITEEIFQ